MLQLSVIVPFYNVQDFAPEALASTDRSELLRRLHCRGVPAEVAG